MGRLRLSAGFLAVLTLLAAPSFMLAETPLAAADLDTAATVDMAGRQRMLSQRMVKTYLLLGQGIAADDARTILHGSLDQFDSQLATLKTFQPTPSVRNAIVKLDAEWMKCKPLLTAASNKVGAVDLYDAGEALQKAAHSVALAYEDVSGAPLDHLINLAGRQRMLSQRMAKFYLYSTWDIYRDPADMELHLSRAHFTAMLNQIEESPLATAQIKARVVQLRREWEPYQQTLFASREPAEMRRNAPLMAELSERVLASTEELVAVIVERARGAAR